MRIAIFLLILCEISFASSAEQAAERYAKFYKKALPHRCNSNLVLNDILNVSDTLIYRYGVNDTKKTWVTKFNETELKKYAQETKNLNLRETCKDKEVLALLDANIALQQLFYDENGKLLFEYEITRLDCLNQK